MRVSTAVRQRTLDSLKTRASSLLIGTLLAGGNIRTVNGIFFTLEVICLRDNYSGLLNPSVCRIGKAFTRYH